MNLAGCLNGLWMWKCLPEASAFHRSTRRLADTQERILLGTLRQNRDTAWYGITDDEWPRLRAAFERWLCPANFDEAGTQRVSLSSLTANLRG